MTLLFIILLTHQKQSSTDLVDPELLKIVGQTTLAFRYSLNDLDELKIKIKESLGKKRSEGFANNSASYFLSKALVDIEILNNLKANPKKAFDFNIFNIGDYLKRFLSAEGGAKVKEIKKMEDNFIKIKKILPQDSSFILIYLSSNFSLLDSPFLNLTSAEKTHFYSEYLLKNFEELSKLGWKDNVFFEYDFSLVKLFNSLNNQESIKDCLNHLEEFHKASKALYSSQSSLNLAADYYKILLYSKKGMDRECIDSFKKIPKMWLEDSDSKLSISKFKIYYLISKSYANLGDSVRAKTYLEVSFSIAFSDSYSKNLVKEVAKQLRDAYLRDKEWTLMRNLEERCSKFGLEALPKQADEN